MPPMVAPGAEESLIDGPADKTFLNYWFYLGSHLRDSEHVEKWVIIILQPEAVHSLNIFNRLSWTL